MFRVKTVSRRGVEMLHLIFRGKRCDIVYKERKRVKPDAPKAPPIPENSSVIISENGDLIYRVEGKYWTCQLTPKERKLVGAVAAAEKQELDGNVAFKMFEFGFGDDKLLRNIISSVNSKLSRQDIPIRLSFTDWIVKFTGNSDMIEKSMP
jgi:hypothetical protein